MASEILKRSKHKIFSCGKCLQCRKRKSKQLAVRCVLHSSLYTENCFLTLTYDESKKDYHNEFDYKDIQRFKKRLRSYTFRRFKKRIEVFNVHEYGKNGKKHWHLVAFNLEIPDRTLHTTRNGVPLYTSIHLSGLWGHGFVAIGDVSEGSAMYTAQYMEKDFKNGHSGTKKRSHSKHSGIGRGYFLKHYKQILSLGYIPFGGTKLPIFRYFEKLAHKHWAHYYDDSFFYDHKERKRRYAPFKNGEANKEIADLYIQYQAVKQEKLQELEKNWEEVMEEHIRTGEKPKFVQSARNAEHDLKNKNNLEKF